MRTSFKEKSMVIAWIAVFFVVMYAIAFFSFSKPKSSGMFTPGIEIIKSNDVQKIEVCKKFEIPYAFKIHDNDKFYIKYYSYENKTQNEINLELTKEQYNNLIEGNKYWLMVRFLKEDKTGDGIVNDIFIEDPTKR